MEIEIVGFSTPKNGASVHVDLKRQLPSTYNIVPTIESLASHLILSSSSPNFVSVSGGSQLANLSPVSSRAVVSVPVACGHNNTITKRINWNVPTPNNQHGGKIHPRTPPSTLLGQSLRLVAQTIPPLHSIRRRFHPLQCHLFCHPSHHLRLCLCQHIGVSRAPENEVHGILYRFADAFFTIGPGSLASVTESALQTVREARGHSDILSKCSVGSPTIVQRVHDLRFHFPSEG